MFDINNIINIPPFSLSKHEKDAIYADVLYELTKHHYANCDQYQRLFDEPLESNLGPQGCCIQSQEFYETDTKRGFVRGYTMQILRGPGPIETALTGSALRDIPWGRGHHQAFAKRFGRTIGIGIIVEDLPELHNRVTLDKSLADSNGIPAPKITYKLGENSKKLLAHGLTAVKKLCKLQVL